MEAITVGFALGVGAALLFKRGRAGLRATVGWSARQIGSMSSRVAATIDDARTTARREYQRGREESLDTMTELPPPSVRPDEARPASKSIPPSSVDATPHKNGSVHQAS